MSSSCTKEGGECDVAKAEAEVALSLMLDAHATMIASCEGSTPPPPPAVPPENPGDLVISEIMYSPNAVSNEEGEWFEIHNPTSTDFELQGLVVQDSGADSFVIDASVVIAAGGFVVLGRNANSSTNGGVILDFEYSNFVLSNSGDEIEILNGTVSIDTVVYPTFFSTTGHAASLDPTFLDAIENDDLANWCDATDLLRDGDRGSPGFVNPSCTG